MRKFYSYRSRYFKLVIIILVIFTACGRNSSPEGRMSIKVEKLQKEMLEQMQEQNKAILDSLGRIREELEELKRQNK